MMIFICKSSLGVKKKKLSAMMYITCASSIISLPSLIMKLRLVVIITDVKTVSSNKNAIV